jgi:hypothetical protein
MGDPLYNVQNFRPSDILAHNVKRAKDDVHMKWIFGVKRSTASTSSAIRTACPPPTTPPPPPGKGREGHNFLNSIPTFICSFVYMFQATSSDMYKNRQEHPWPNMKFSERQKRHVLNEFKKTYSKRVRNVTIQAMVWTLATTWCSSEALCARETSELMLENTRYFNPNTQSWYQPENKWFIFCFMERHVSS